MMQIGQSNRWLKKWTLICSVLLIVAVAIPIPLPGNIFFWLPEYMHLVDFRDKVSAFLASLFLLTPLLLLLRLNGKPLSAALLTYCCIAQIALFYTLIIPIASMANLYTGINDLGIQSPGIRIVAHMSVYGGVSFVPMILLLVALAAGDQLSRKLVLFRYPYVICGLAAGFILLGFVVALTNLFLEYPRDFFSLGHSGLWTQAWHLLGALLWLGFTCLFALVQSIRRSALLVARISLHGFVFLVPLLILGGSLAQMAELNLTTVIPPVLLYLKITAGLYGMYFLFTASLITIMEQNTSIPHIQPRPRKGKPNPAPASSSPLEDTVIVR